MPRVRPHHGADAISGDSTAPPPLGLRFPLHRRFPPPLHRGLSPPVLQVASILEAGTLLSVLFRENCYMDRRLVRSFPEKEWVCCCRWSFRHFAACKTPAQRHAASGAFRVWFRKTFFSRKTATWDGKTVRFSQKSTLFGIAGNWWCDLPARRCDERAVREMTGYRAGDDERAMREAMDVPHGRR